MGQQGCLYSGRAVGQYQTSVGHLAHAGFNGLYDIFEINRDDLKNVVVSIKGLFKFIDKQTLVGDKLD